MDLAYHAYVVIVLTSFVIPEVILGQVTLNCTFEVDQCGWVQALDDDFDWTRQQSNTQTPHTGPSGDHTVGTGGYFMYIDNVSSYNRGDSARLMSPPVSLEANRPQCLTFWYHMHGAHIEKLNVYIADSNSLGDIKWTRLGTQGNAWLRGEMTIMVSVNSTKMVVFEALHGIIHGDIAIDDILLTRGACVPDFCNFEDMNSPLCDGTQDQNDDIDWSVSTGTLGSPIDHTLGTVYGHYLYISATAQNTGKKAKYITSTFAGSSTLQCFQFYYTRSDEAIATFSVYIQVGGSQGSAVWSKSTSLGDGWFQAQITVDSESDFQVVFEAMRTSATSGYIGFDDFLVLNGNCASVGNLQGSCDFENGLCSWKNIYNDDIDWTENTGSTKTGSTGPQTDHTKGTADGVYMYLEASNVGEGVVSKLISAPYDANNQEDICLNFWYHMYGSDIGTLQVQQVTASGTTNLWTLFSDQGDEWINGQVGIHQYEDYQLVLNATRGQGTRGDISVDDISVTTGYCPIIYTPFDCDFELSVCGWTQASDDIFDFERHQGGTGSPHTGPSVDHTTGTVGGWYMFIDNSKDRDLGDAARLHSPEERFPANQAKCLIFW
ncbi:MAM and LDL-receptor class A domain-containing protein 1-like [Glandiceps talaboti]